ncbi:hypothetical protein L483_23525 [Pseudomonas putida H8234]|nr:hypothetical protein L483_23525 [Pseudomonas putida H8234]
MAFASWSWLPILIAIWKRNSLEDLVAPVVAVAVVDAEAVEAAREAAAALAAAVEITALTMSR